MPEEVHNRRTFMRRAAGAAGAIALAPSLTGLIARSRGALGAAQGTSSPLSAVRWARVGAGSYGPLVTGGPELLLPEGFSYRVLSRNGQPMTDGTPTPGAFDGMAAFPMPNGNIRLLRNHENRDPPASSRVKGNPALAYDGRAGGAVSTLEIRVTADGTPELVRDFISLGGTIVNCAGGPTPWGSWLTCEESVAGRRAGWREEHGYIFEVPASANRQVAPVPLKAMGRFVHEAVAVDPRSGIVYETEDQQTAGFYRFLPRRRDRMVDGGRLQMLAIRGMPRYDTATGQTPGAWLPVTWVDIDEPNPPGDPFDPLTLFRKGTAGGGARFARLEGCWYGDGSIYFHATSGGDAQVGQVWRYQPGELRREDRLALVFESPSADILDSPDNITVSPRGGIVMCEDGAGEQYLRGLTPQGELFNVAKNVLNLTEFAGACFSPDGRILFVNIMGSTRDAGLEGGCTVAIRGQWERGAL